MSDVAYQAGTAEQKPGPQAIWPDGIPALVVPYTPAIKVNEWVFVSGFIASDFKTGVATAARAQNPYVENDMELQARFLLANAARTVRAAGCDLGADIVRIAQWFPSARPSTEDRDAENFWPAISALPYLRARDEVVHAPWPAETALSLRDFPVRTVQVGVEIFCFDPAAGKSVPILSLNDGGAGNSRSRHAGVRRGNWVFLSGQTAAGSDGVVPPALNELRFWEGSPVEAQTEAVLQKLAALAEAAGSSLQRAVKAEVHIGHPRHYADMDRVWRRWFPNNPPARCVIPNVGFGASNARIEIALTLLADDAPLKIETIETSDAPEPFGHEPQAVKVGNLLFLSQQMACDSKGLLLEGMSRHSEFPWYGQPGRAQTRLMIKNIAAICEAAGSSLENVVRCARVFDDSRWFAESFAEWDSHFPKRKCTSIPLHLGGELIVPGANVMFDVIAYVPD